MSAVRLQGEGDHGRGDEDDEDEEEDDEGELEEEDVDDDDDMDQNRAPIMDATVSTATLALQARRNVGRPLRWMEQVKMERLRQVNAAPAGLPHLSPTPPAKGHSLPTILGKGKGTTEMCVLSTSLHE